MRALLLLAGLAACTDGAPDPVDTDPTDGTDTDTDTDRADTDTDTDTDDTDIEDTDVPCEGPAFCEISAASGLTDLQYPRYTNPFLDCSGSSYHGGGASLGDVNGDGHLDLFFAVYDAPSKLYLGDGEGGFIDASERLPDLTGGWPVGGTFADVDSDGDLDLAVSFNRYRWAALLINDGTGTFTDETVARGLDIREGQALVCPMNWTIAFGDPDLDGDLDMVIGSWDIVAGNGSATSSAFLENDGTGHFVETTEAVDLIHRQGLFTFTPLFGDVNDDGWPDLAMTSDFLTNHLLLNDGDGTFALEQPAGVEDVENGMGGQLVDLDDDGDLDWIITAIWDDRPEHENLWGQSGNRIYLNDGTGAFTDVSEDWGLRNGRWAWGISAFDFDNDGDLDIGWTNGHQAGAGAQYLIEPFLDDPTALYVREDTADGPVWTESAAALGLVERGQGRGFVPFDHDEDGDLDILITRWGEAPALFRNEGLAGDRGWLTVRVRSEGANTYGVGATVVVQATPGSTPVRREIHANPSYLSQGPIEAHFGLGEHEGPLHRVTLRWPYGDDLVLEDVEPDRTLTLRP